MKFEDINEQSKVYPGEFVLHQPTNQVVLVGAYNRKENFIRCLSQGSLLIDEIKNFKKIVINKKEYKNAQYSTGCKGCSGG
tara:strand:- start:524 stop:766 length:243 start_codon:yes stop_codon:yes gene_type:complete